MLFRKKNKFASAIPGNVILNIAEGTAEGTAERMVYNINVSSMKFNLLKIIELPLRSRTGVLRRAPGEGENGGGAP